MGNRYHKRKIIMMISINHFQLKNYIETDIHFHLKNKNHFFSQLFSHFFSQLCFQFFEQFWYFSHLTSSAFPL